MARILKTAYTFDDVLLVPNKSEVLPNEVSLKTQLTKKIQLNIPLIHFYLYHLLLLFLLFFPFHYDTYQPPN